jgi:predicted SPOUT superfamily RNA methylase MTH1
MPRLGPNWEGRRTSVAIPASLVSDTPHLREKTGKLGLIARACSIFRVTEIVLYVDDARRDQKAELELCTQILRFIETPQYLRKRMFGLNPVLRYAGILPPLQTPPHDVPHTLEECKMGELREGLVIGSRGGTLSVDVGLGTVMQCKGDLRIGSRVTTRIVTLAGEFAGEIVDTGKSSPRELYWGYSVSVADSSLDKFIKNHRFDLKIGTSRYGSSLQTLWPRFANSLKNATDLLIAFGSPKMGLKDILVQQGEAPENLFDYFINTVPDQSVSTVRTEEAIFISLAIFNLATSIY